MYHAFRALTPLRALVLVASFAIAAGCESGLPANVVGYQGCLKMNANPLPQRSDDPHTGLKDVFACHVTEDDLLGDDGNLTFPYPEGTLIVKASTKPHQGYVWLVATAEKTAGKWRWKEYTRNFDNEAFRPILASESVCTDCHQDAAPTDWIFTRYAP